MLELIPDKMAVCHDEPTTLDLLIRITPPPPPQSFKRPDLNLTLALDRSGSMDGSKMLLTRQAAGLVVRHLREVDVLSIVLFDDRIETLLSRSHITDKNRVLALIEQIESRGSTDLFGGWRTGGELALAEARPTRLNRVLLLTDGEANVGETNTDVICDYVHKLAQQGVQTTTLGFGSGYNEDLLRAIAQSGQGNHFYVETPEQLTAFFEMELAGLLATQGTQVRLLVESLAPRSSVKWLAEVDSTPDCEIRLGDLVSGAPLAQMVRLQIPAQATADARVRARLSWHCPQEAQRKELEVVLSLPLVSAAQRQSMPLDVDVQVQLAAALANTARQEIMAHLKAGNERQALGVLKEALKLPHLQAAEREALEDLRRTVQRGDHGSVYKKVAMHGHGHGHGHGSRMVLSQLPTTDLFDHANLRVLRGPLFGTTPAAGRRPWRRMEGMLRGLFYGERRGWGPKGPMGEASRLTVATLQCLMGSPFRVNALADSLAQAPTLAPSPSLLTLQTNLQMDKPLDQLGGTTAGCAALRRIAPILIPHGRQADASLWREVALATMLTHNDSAAIVSSLGFVALLWDLLAMNYKPSPNWYLERFLQAIQGLETTQTYPALTRRFRGWKGTLSEFLEHVIPDARAKRLTVEQVMKGWGSGPYLLEQVPTLLYILERHGDNPKAAFAFEALDGHSLGALLGAALGALHGPQPEWVLEPELEAAIHSARHEWDH